MVTIAGTALFWAAALGLLALDWAYRRGHARQTYRARTPPQDRITRLS